MIARALGLIREHPRKTASAAVLLFLGAAWLSMGPEPAPEPRKVASSASASSSSASAKVLLATANLVVTADGCEHAEITFGPGGAPTGVRARGGRLTVQAKVETNERITTTAWSASATSYTASEPVPVAAGPSRFPLALRGGIRPSGLWAAGARWDFEAPVPFFPRHGLVLGPGITGGPGLLLFTLDVQPTRRGR